MPHEWRQTRPTPVGQGPVVPQYAETVRAVVLCGTLIYELIGPSVSKWALTQAGEIVE